MTKETGYNAPHAVATVRNILEKAGITPSRTSPGLQVMESAILRVIRALHKSGFHRTAPLHYEYGFLALRRMDTLVELQLPGLIFGADQFVQRERRKAELWIDAHILSAEMVAERVRQDAQIDVTYESMLDIYKAKQESNAWRNSMQFVMPKDPEVLSLVRLFDGGVHLHESGSAIEEDHFDIRWGRQDWGTIYARMRYMPSSGRFEIQCGTGKFSWHYSGQGFRYRDTLAALQRDVEAFLAENGDESPHRWLSRFHEAIMRHQV